MSFVEDIIEDLPGSETKRSLTGQTAAEAAERGARAQAEAGREASRVAEEAQFRLEETLAPFVQALGVDLMPQVGALFGPESQIGDITQDPANQAILNEVQRRVQAQQSAGGRPAVETGQFLQDALLRTSSDLLQRERAEQSRQRSDLLGALQFGQSSAAQTGVSGIQTGQNVGNLLTQIANAQAAGGIGAAQAQAQGAQNLLQTGAGIAGMIWSDRRLKRNITKAGKYKDYDTYKYQYKNSDQWYIGVMAQEVQKIKPEAVMESDGYLMVDYGAL